MKITTPLRRSRSRGAHRAGPPLRILGLLAILAAGIALLLPSLASADSASTLTVVGTSDVSDSGLIPNVIQPAFTEAYPQYTFKYIGTATGTAITDAETGSVGASALIVHAASLENQFVAGGYSEAPFGQALWTNDFVLAGPTTDPAGVHANAPNNAAQAFADVAAAGIAGTAEFVSRGGTAGTTVEEHQIWALVASSNLEPAGLTLCVVNAANGGGDTPVAATAGVANGAPCPNAGALPTAAALPAWYAATGLTQGPNVIAANACAGYKSGPNTCYVLTDRGTYDYLASGTDPAGAVPNLTIQTRDDSASAPGGQYALINYFHGYIINPAQPGETVNLPAAQDFLSLITSPVIQARIGAYLTGTSDAGGAPFKPDASPLITTMTALPAHYRASKAITLTGTVANQEPGYPALAGIPVSVDRVLGGASIPVKSVKADATGAFTLTFTPPATGRYALSTPQFSQVEVPTLDPTFSDTFTPAATAAKYVAVTGAISQLRARSLNGRALVQGAVSPDTGHVNGEVSVYARPFGSKGGYSLLSAGRLSSTDGRFAAEGTLAPGRWQIKTTFSDRGTILAARARTTALTVGAGSPDHITPTGASVSKSGRLVAHASVSPSVKGGKVSLVLAKLTGSGRAATYTAATATLAGGQQTVTLHTTLKGSGRWAVLESYAVAGRTTAWTTKIGRVTIAAKSK